VRAARKRGFLWFKWDEEREHLAIYRDGKPVVIVYKQSDEKVLNPPIDPLLGGGSGLLQ
jgi:hypothetical protein